MIEERGQETATSREESSDMAALDRSLSQATASLEAARAILSLRKTVGRNLRIAIRSLLEAQERIETEGPSTAARLDLLEAIRLIGAVEQEIKSNLPSAPVDTTRDDEVESPQNRRAYQRLPARLQIQLEPETRTHRQDISALPLHGTTVNVSRGGMLAKIDQGILRHGRYLIRFLEASGAIQPEVIWGAVRRSRARNKGWEVGIEFDDPLEDIK
ncbi:MAG: PilZ domain-containing protein [Acidobacteriota bacterium]|jgi:hypothetical protein